MIILDRCSCFSSWISQTHVSIFCFHGCAGWWEFDIFISWSFTFFPAAQCGRRMFRSRVRLESSHGNHKTTVVNSKIKHYRVYNWKAYKKVGENVQFLRIFNSFIGSHVLHTSTILEWRCDDVCAVCGWNSCMTISRELDSLLHFHYGCWECQLNVKIYQNVPWSPLTLNETVTRDGMTRNVNTILHETLQV